MDGELAEDTSVQARTKFTSKYSNSHLRRFHSFTVELVAVAVAHVRLLRSRRTTVFYIVRLVFGLVRNPQRMLEHEPGKG